MSAMPSIPETFAAAAPGEMLISRTVAAPRELVFDVWTQEEHLLKWWGPRDFPVSVVECDPQVGGAFNFTMVGPGGIEAPAGGVFEVVERPGRLVVRNWVEHDGVVVYETRVTVTFDQHGDYTRLVVQTEVVRNEGFPGAAGAKEGWSQQLDKLTEHLARLG